MNGGSSTGTSAQYTATNGGWNSGTGVFTPASGDPSASGVTVGAFASVYIDGATTPVFIGRVTAVNSTTVTVSTTAKSGTAPTTNASARSIKVGGAWKGPNGAVAFPFGFITNTLTNSSGHPPRVNFISGTNYAITANMSHGNAGPMVFQGYTSSVADGGKATIDGGTGGASYQLLTTTGTNLIFRDLIFQNNGATGNAYGVNIQAPECQMIRVVINNVRGIGLAYDTDGPQFATEVECYACNQAAVAGWGGIYTGAATTVVRGMFHDNTSTGALVGGIMSVFIDCTFDSNTSHGAYSTGSIGHYFKGCDFYNNGGSGIYSDAGLISVHVESCNFVKNGGYGISHDTATGAVWFLSNCGFGSGTQANTSGNTNFNAADAVTNENAVTYASNVTPWVDPANGDFRINLAVAINAGRGSFTQTAASYAGTIGYPDIGAGQHLESASGGPRFGLAGAGPSFRGVP